MAGLDSYEMFPRSLPQIPHRATSILTQSSPGITGVALSTIANPEGRPYTKDLLMRPRLFVRMNPGIVTLNSTAFTGASVDAVSGRRW